MMKHTKNAFVLLFSLLFALLSGCTTKPRQQEPYNKIVIMLDASGTYQKRQTEAIAKVEKLLEGISQTKLKRWDKSLDQVTIISIDAVPEVIWQGSLKELKDIKQSEWAARFQARTDYASCTDIGAAFSIAASKLDGDSRFITKYLFAFTDLINEPPASSIKVCKKPTKPSLPPETMPWDSFNDISVSIFWIPAEQKLAWQRSVAEQGLENSFALYTTSESGQVKISPPPRAIANISDEEKAMEREETKSKIFSWLKVLAIGLAVVFIGMILFVWFTSRRNNSSRRTTQPQSVRGQSVAPRVSSKRLQGNALGLRGPRRSNYR